MALSDQAKSGLESGAWINGYDYQNKDKKLPLRRIKSVTFFVQCIIAKTYVIPHLVIADILDVILNNLHRLKQQQQASQIL